LCDFSCANADADLNVANRVDEVADDKDDASSSSRQPTLDEEPNAKEESADKRVFCCLLESMCFMIFVTFRNSYEFLCISLRIRNYSSASRNGISSAHAPCH
jgi:hypothetical protein